LGGTPCWEKFSEAVLRRFEEKTMAGISGALKQLKQIATGVPNSIRKSENFDRKGPIWMKGFLLTISSWGSKKSLGLWLCSLNHKPDYMLMTMHTIKNKPWRF
jgi:hypothetical protein